ncbi:MAG: nucleoside hydrolase [Pseudomonadota bacterium]
MTQTTIPVVLDTDIGSDIDDTWALAQLLKSPEIDLKLVVSCTGDTEYRARIAAKLIESAGRSDIDIGVGLPGKPLDVYPQQGFVEGYALSDYAGTVHQDGVSAMIDAIMASEEKITLLSIGPVTNIAEALKREPRIVEKVRFVGMHGAVRKGYKGADEVAPEYNVYCDIPACQAVFEADWEMTITPLDTCGITILRDEPYQQVLNSQDPVAQAMMENYRVWLETFDRGALFERRSTTIYDTVAAYLTYSEELLEMETLGIRIDDKGFTRVDESAKPIRVATGWRDLNEFYRHLATRLTS